MLASNALGAPGNTLRVLVTLPLVVFVPGYALAAAAFPRAPVRERRGSLLDRVRERPSGVDTTERVALGLGLSLALLPVVGLLVAFEPGPFSTETSIVGLSGAAALFTVVAAIRRWRLSADERYGPPIGYWRAVAGSTTEGSRTDVLLSVGLGLSVAFALVAGGYAIAAPLDAQESSYVGAGYLNATGDFVAETPDNMEEGVSPGTSVDSAFYVKNAKDRTVEYTVVVQVQRYDDQGNLQRVSELNRYRQALEPGQEWINPHQATLRLQGENVRLTYLLFEGPVPAGASIDSPELEAYAYHSVSVGSSEDD
nr:DUF1616 domain-containing protein [Halomarina oriensis]